MQDKRQTGRTTRMLQAALHEATVNGRAVYVVMPYELMAQNYRRMPEYRALRFETLDSLKTLDWQSGRLVGAHPNCLVFVDHAAVEMRFRWLLEQATRFDSAVHISTPEES